tara:strand:- start:31059 stop:32057 length:999 start_codon:yes stop_codon:yes gene_type:complete
MCTKRGQVTTFLIVGVIILFVAIGVFYISSKITKDTLVEEVPDLSTNEGKITSFVESCIRNTLTPAVYLLAANGGEIYFENVNSILLTNNGMINYAKLNGINRFSNSKMEEDLSRYLNKYIDLCIIELIPFQQQGLNIDINYADIDSKIAIGNHKVSTELNLPITIKSDKKTLQLTKFSQSIDTNYGDMIDTANNILVNKDLIQLPVFKYDPVLFPYDKNTDLYSLTDTQSQNPIILFFAVKNDDVINKKPNLAYIPDQSFLVNQIWETSLIASDPNGNPLEFSSNSDLFPISGDGDINIEINQPGKHTVTFTVTDSGGLSDSQQVTINVLT